jgi:hypothetical protein
MKVLDHIKQSIITYPTLYLFPTFESSQIRVLDHMFGVLGNGYTWAYTKNPKKGGYLCRDKYRRYKGEWVRIYDWHYGVEECNIDIKRWFTEPIVEVYSIGTGEDVFLGFESEYNKHKLKLFWENNQISAKKATEDSVFHIKKNIIKENIEHYNHCYKTKKLFKFDGWVPYPNFRKKYSPFWKDEAKHIQEDWRLAGLYWLQECKDFFNDPERIIHYPRYPTFEEMAQERWNKELERIKEFLEETTFKLLE